MSDAWGSLRIVGLVAAAVALGHPAAIAHELPGTTARITLRDGHVEVRLEVAPVQWLQRVSGGDAGDVRFLAQADPAGLDVLRQRARAELGEAAVLRVDGRAVRPTAVRFPGEPIVRETVVRALLQEAAGRPAPPGHVSVVLEARLEAAPGRIDLALPPSMGPFQAELIAPRTTIAPAGGAAHFDLVGGRP